MGLTKLLTAVVAASSLLVSSTLALDPKSKTNLAVYYGQGAYQDRLRHFCEQTSLDIIPLSFVHIFPEQGPGGYPGSNYGNQCADSYFVTKDGIQTKLLSDCHQISEDIPICQALGKTILLSLGGGVRGYKITTQKSATNFADFLWGAYGPKTDAWGDNFRPFGDNVLDGFDFDIEYDGDYGYTTMVNRLRNRFKEDPSRRYYISAAPQCLPDDPQLAKPITDAYFDFIFVQFYNTPQCSAASYVANPKTSKFSFDQWVQVVKKSKNPSARIFIGLPASPIAANAGYYITPPQVQPMVEKFMKKYPSNFGGIMLWEATQSDLNQYGGMSYADNMKKILYKYSPPVTTTSKATTSTTTIRSSTSTRTSTSTTSTSTTRSSTTTTSVSTRTTTTTPTSTSTRVSTTTTKVTTQSTTQSSSVSTRSTSYSASPTTTSQASTSTTVSTRSSTQSTSAPSTYSQSSSSPTLTRSTVSTSDVSTRYPTESVSTTSTSHSASPTTTTRATTSPTLTRSTVSTSDVSTHYPTDSYSVSTTSTSHSASPTTTTRATVSTSDVSTRYPTESYSVSTTRTSHSASPTTTTRATISHSSSISTRSSTTVPTTSSSAKPTTNTTPGSSVYPTGGSTSSTVSSVSPTEYTTSSSYSGYPTGSSSSGSPTTLTRSTTLIPTYTPSTKYPTTNTTAAPTLVYPTAAYPSGSGPEPITTVIVTSYLSICPTGYTTVTTSYTTTYHPGTASATPTTVTLTVPVETYPAAIPTYPANPGHEYPTTLSSVPVPAVTPEPVEHCYGEYCPSTPPATPSGALPSHSTPSGPGGYPTGVSPVFPGSAPALSLGGKWLVTAVVGVFVVFFGM
ncbi:hypothetical protein FQN50_006133 [Emmonsiellopsis sp. PD_5]|nr:hypothetical protein FQN50_006133 [Emmonsiellopsis sp. PD_5]